MFQKYRLREKIYDFIVIFQHWLFRYFGYFAQNLEDRDQSSAIYIVLSAASFVLDSLRILKFQDFVYLKSE